MNCLQHLVPIVTLSFTKRRWLGQVYVIIDACIHPTGTITFQNTAGAGAAVIDTNKKVIIKSCAHSINSVSEINNKQVYETQDIILVIPTQT